MKMSNITVSRLWGGTRLWHEWGFIPNGDNIAEAWVLSCREDAMSRAENGEHAGKPLSELTDKSFPLLIKLIDAKQKLSVQVHPDDDCAAANGERDTGKNEMWYILDADEGAEIVYGLKEGVSVSDFLDAAKDGKGDSLLNFVPVKAGDCFYIPAGLVHGIGGGILLAEIQQNSDLTYRLYDYGRRDKNGKLRELHTEKGKAATRAFTDDMIYSLRYEHGKDGDLCLANNRYFRTDLLIVTDEEKTVAASDSFRCLLSVKGNAEIIYNNEQYVIGKGDTYFLPAGLGDCRIRGNAEILIATV